MSVTEARALLQGRLPKQEYRKRTEDGWEFPVVIGGQDVNLSVLEYRPIYLSGDVAKPGEQTYRPGLTVRQAIALAWGFDILRFKMDNPFLQLADLRSDYNTLWIEYAKEQAHVERLRAELNSKPTLDAKGLTDLPTAPSLATEITINERDHLAARNADFAKEQAYLKGAVSKEADRAKVLSDQQLEEQGGAKADVEDLHRYQELNKKGAVALPALAEARRTVLPSSTRVLQTTALLASLDREQCDLARVHDARRLEVVGEMEVANAQLATVRARLQSVSDKLRYAGMVKSQLVRGTDSYPDIAVFRNDGGKQTKVSAGMDAPLQPGDVVEIALQAEQPGGVTTTN